ncbi:hypothetical protein [Vibrio algarum]|uniref:AsmA family protein n=1 Tax=Vibrio algarum TaxID=3020714 RepID=A0ABT4YRS3_9VIBR|nr:hypothetical protein [Vibrio sp. KJ40-1]MDB1124254.1 hypothetical protein [Vibrio sp. KJ40-1]
MWGQWFGNISGSNSAFVTLNIDKDSPFSGVLLVHDFDESKPCFYADIRFNVDGSTLNAQVSNFRLPSYYITPNELKASLPQIANFVGSISTTNEITGNWQSNVETSGNLNLVRKDDIVLNKADASMTWSEFQSWSLQQKN